MNFLYIPIIFLLQGQIEYGDYRAACKLAEVIDVKQLSYEDKLKYNFYSMCLAIYKNEGEEASKYAQLVLDHFDKIPYRYEAMANAVLYDSKNWTKDDLADIARNMSQVRIDLNSGYGGKKVQAKQQEIIDQLDKLIKEKEDKANSAASDAAKAEKNKQDPNGGIPSSPLPDSVPSDVPGSGEVFQKKLQHYQKNWGQLPEHERVRAIQELTRDLPPRFKQVIEDYFKALNKN